MSKNCLKKKKLKVESGGEFKKKCDHCDKTSHKEFDYW